VNNPGPLPALSPIDTDIWQQNDVLTVIPSPYPATDRIPVGTTRSHNRNPPERPFTHLHEGQRVDPTSSDE